LEGKKGWVSRTTHPGRRGGKPCYLRGKLPKITRCIAEEDEKRQKKNRISITSLQQRAKLLPVRKRKHKPEILSRPMNKTCTNVASIDPRWKKETKT